VVAEPIVTVLSLAIIIPLAALSLIADVQELLVPTTPRSIVPPDLSLSIAVDSKTIEF